MFGAFLSITRVALLRLAAQRGLALAAALGLVIASALAMSVPTYADSVYHRMLTARAAGDERDPLKPVAPFSLLFQHLNEQRGAATPSQVAPADDYLHGSAAERDLGLPLLLNVRHVKTYALELYPPGQDPRAGQPAFSASFGSISGIEQHITLLAGRLPSASPGGPLEVLISPALAEKRKLQPGDELLAFHRDATRPSQPPIARPVRVAGIWQASDRLDPFWFFDPATFDELLLLAEPALLGPDAADLQSQRWISAWYLVPDPAPVRANGVDELLRRVSVLQGRAAAALPDLTPRITPAPLLEEYRQATGALTFLMFAFSAPLVALLLAFINLVVGLTVERRRNEIAILRSRGAGLTRVLTITAIESALLCLGALALGLPLSQAITALIGRTRSFLNFSLPGELSISITSVTLLFGAATAALAFAAQLLPTVEAARHTIVTYKQSRARELRPPWWQRVWLDLLLLIPAGYGVLMLRRSRDAATPAGGLNDPLLLLVPALGIFAVTLLLLRLLPRALAGIAFLAMRTRSVGLALAARHLARAPALYSAPMILLVLTLSLATFTASLAQTLDQHLSAQMYYQTGGELLLKETGQCLRFEASQSQGVPPCQTNANLAEGPIWAFPPLEDHLRAPGVQAALRVGRWGAEAQIAGEWQSSAFVAIDPAEFARLAFWRADFASQSLDELMRALAARPDGVLVSRELVAGGALRVGDTLQLRVITGRAYTVSRTIVGVVNYFPTWYPQERKPLFVGGLQAFFDEVGGAYPYNVWLRSDPSADPAAIVATLRGLKQYPPMNIERWAAAPIKITDEQARPERQGLFGLLSVGFVASAVLTVLGFLLYALFSFRQRFIELGMLRAIGLSARQMRAYLGWELAFLIGFGLLIGTGLGILVSMLFVPALQTGADAASQVPPFHVTIAWAPLAQVYLLFALLFVGALAGLAGLLMRMKIFQAVKLGETT